MESETEMTDPIRQAIAAKSQRKASYVERLLGKPAVEQAGDSRSAEDILAEAVHGTELVVETAATEKPKDAVDVSGLSAGAMPSDWQDGDTTGDWLRDQYLIARDGSI